MAAVDAERARRLEELPGWVWNRFDALWEKGFSELSAYCARTGVADSPHLRLAQFQILGGLDVVQPTATHCARRACGARSPGSRLESIRGHHFLADAAFEQLIGG